MVNSLKPFWDKNKGNNKVELVMVQNGSEEFKFVQNNLMSGEFKSKVKIISITKIYNMYQLDLFT